MEERGAYLEAPPQDAPSIDEAHLVTPLPPFPLQICTYQAANEDISPPTRSPPPYHLSHPSTLTLTPLYMKVPLT